jgi:carbamoylphosphate synthase large subunit
MVSMSPPVVWVNKYLSNTWEVLARLLQDRRPGEFELVCSHPWPEYPGRRHADHFVVEPRGLSDAAYVQWCMQVVVIHKVRLFIPGRKLLAISEAAPQFAHHGVSLLTAASCETLKILMDKSATYRELAGSICPIPDYEVVTDSSEFEQSIRRLQQKHPRVCFKPTRSIYGIGFYVIGESRSERRERFLHLAEATRYFHRKTNGVPTMVMEYLPGPERSVDCLADHGHLIGSIIRRKEPGIQFIEQHQLIEEIVHELTRRFQLNGIFNVQFADARGKPHLLEINPRMSGGLPISYKAGVNLLLWAIRLSLGTCHAEDVPRPRCGFSVPQPEPWTFASR